MPKFKTEFKMELKPVLMGMGMEAPFSDAANFSGFFRDNVGEASKISEVIHQSFIEVSESGTEAAAATSVGIVLTSAGGSQRPPIIRIDHSFVYLIHEEQSGAILFAGKIANPIE